MIGHRQLVQEWRARLGAYQGQLADERSRRPWMARVYVRVLTFLLRQYGTETDLPELRQAGSRALQPPDPVGPQSQMPLVVATDLVDGKPAKSSATIRTVLENLHAANPVTAAGPLKTGRAGVELITLASYDNPRVAWAAFRRLRELGIQCRLDHGWRVTRLIVPTRDSQRAWEAVAGFLQDCIHRPSRRGE